MNQEVNTATRFFPKVIHYGNMQSTGGNYDFRGVNSLLMGNYQLPFHVLGLPLSAPSCLSADKQPSVIMQLRCLQTLIYPHLMEGPFKRRRKALEFGGSTAATVFDIQVI